MPNRHTQIQNAADTNETPSNQKPTRQSSRQASRTRRPALTEPGETPANLANRQTAGNAADSPTSPPAQAFTGWQLVNGALQENLQLINQNIELISRLQQISRECSQEVLRSLQFADSHSDPQFSRQNTPQDSPPIAGTTPTPLASGGQTGESVSATPTAAGSGDLSDALRSVANAAAHQSQLASRVLDRQQDFLDSLEQIHSLVDLLASDSQRLAGRLREIEQRIGSLEMRQSANRVY